MTNYNDGNWHGWNGGECPVHPKTIIEIVTLDRGSEGDEWEAGDCHWQNDTRIVAFRVINEYKAPREWWIGSDGQAYADRDLAIDSFGHHARGHLLIIHVIEVLE